MYVLLLTDLLNTERHLFLNDHHKDRKSREVVERSYLWYHKLIPSGYPKNNEQNCLVLPSFVFFQQNNNFQTDSLLPLNYTTSSSHRNWLRSWTLTFWQTTEGIPTVDRRLIVISHFRMTIAVIIGREVPSTSRTIEITHFREGLEFSIVLFDNFIVWCSQRPI